MEEGIRQWVEAALSPAQLRAIHQWAIRNVTEPAVLADLHDRLLERVVDLVVDRMRREGWGGPPASYCWLQLGSGGRREQMIGTDQDNALVYEPLPAAEEDEVEGYFSEMARRVVADLVAVGYPLCQGYVMAVNPRWRGTMEQWIERMRRYVAYPDWANIRLLLIAVDQRPVCGKAELGIRLRRRLVDALGESRYILWSAAKHAMEQPVALTAFGHIRTATSGEWTGTMDVKAGLYVPLVGSVRLWAVHARLEEPATSRRIEALAETGIWTKEDARQVTRALETCIRLRWRRHRETVLIGDPPDDRIRVSGLSEAEREDLRRALIVARTLQKRTYQYFQHLYRRG